MKKLCILLLCLLVSANCYAASTFTTRLNLEKPAEGDSGWGTTLRSNWDIEDTAIGTQHNVSGDHLAITPDSDNLRDIGTSVKEYKDIYIDGVGFIDRVSGDTATINAITTDTAVIRAMTVDTATFDTVTILQLDTFSLTPSAAPTVNYQVANKKYVDDNTSSFNIGYQVIPAAAQENITTDNTYVTAVWGTEIFDLGTNFAANTFTAPTTGKYWLGFHLRWRDIDSAATAYQATIVTSNRTYTHSTTTDQFAGDLSLWSMDMSVLADMDASDTAIVQVRQNGGTAQSDVMTDSFFCGYRVD